MTPYITEILDEINKDPSLLKTKYSDHYAIKTILQYAFDKRGKMLLPEGEPPYKKDDAPIGMSPANFYQQVKKFYIFTRTDLSPVRREQLFIQLLEGLHPSESTICIAIKDQNITSLYPNITADLVVAAGLVEEANIFRKPLVPGQEVAKGKELLVNIQDTTNANTATVQVKKGPGRPKKVVEEIEPKRKPGRPKKVVDET